MSKQSERVKEWRRHTKEKMVQGMGGKCQLCMYAKCNDALELHHIDPGKKEFNFGRVMAKPKKWESIVTELKKCILLCANCHREFHSGSASLPAVYQKFDEQLIVAHKGALFDACPICGKQKNRLKITCSQSCAGRKAWRVNWNTVNFVELLKTKSIAQIADDLGISSAAVAKRMKKLNLIPL